MSVLQKVFAYKLLIVLYEINLFQKVLFLVQLEK